MNFPAIVSATATGLRSLIADDIMTFGHYEAALLAKKNRKLCFSLTYFLMFGRMPRTLKTIQSSTKR